MKKYLIIIFAAIVGMFVSSCAEKEIVTYQPENLTAPVLSELAQSEYTLTDGGAFADFTFTKSSVGLSASIQYELFAILSGEGAVPKTLGKVTNGEMITVTANTLNNVLIGLECAADQPVVVNFYITSNWMSNSNKAIGVATTSNTISATVTPFFAEKTYKSIYFRGGFNGWNAMNSYRLFCYKEDDNTYVGTVDFDGEGKIADHIAQGFKFADDAWGDINLGSSVSDADAAIMTLVSGGDNIMAYTTHRYYSFEVDIANLTAYKLYGFDKVGVIGLNGDWNNDIEMTWNPYFGRFWADVEVPAATEYKVRMDGEWTNDWGLGGVKGGPNIPLESGNYRIYFYFSNAGAPTFEANTDMYGQEEPKEPVPPTPEVKYWSLMGEIGDSVWDSDFNMSESNGVWSTTANIKGQFKLRYGADWAINRGAEGEVEPVEVALDTDIPVIQGGKNFTVPEEGLYMVVFDTTANMIKVSDMGNKWSLIGEVNGSSWDKDFFMTEVDGVWVSDAVTFANADGAEGSFKLRFNASWDDANTRGASAGGFIFEAGKEFDVVSPGSDIKAPSATDKYIVTYNPESNKVTINPALPQNLWSLIGGIEGSGWGKDFYMTQDPTGAWISDPVTIDAPFKIRFNNDWPINRGGVMEGFGRRFAVTQDGADISLPTYDVKYQVVYYPDLEQISVHPCTDAWSVVGGINGTSWNYDIVMSYIEEKNIWVSDIFYVEDESGFKIRFNQDWIKDFGGTFAAIGEPFSAAPGGTDIKIGKKGYYTLVYDVDNSTITINYGWGIIGQVNGSSWDKDFWLRKNGPDTMYSAPFTADGNFKLRAGGDWVVNRGGALVALDTPFAVTQDGPDINPLTAGAKYKLVYDTTADTITVSAAE